MKRNGLRTIIPLLFLLLAGITFVAHTGLGTLSAVGWQDISVLCPIGALGTMLASKSLVPRALISLALFAVGVLLVGGGDVTWSVLLIPALLLVEVVFFRKWCSHICPISSLMSLLSKGNKTFLPAIDDTKCIETSKGRACGRCAEVCEVGIDPRHPDLGSGWNECTKCRACLENCPGNAISMPFLAKCRSGSENRTASAQHPDAAG
ncbi:4Fe-4S binding protein [Curtanaerobium respiraculi]|uniref:4Fe-4S binding protein n=1 Tax=Curtanaerobium respiraculi TaxID=2949669 RepID=UPI0024B32992|nr:4Fe-4S binding protein [Curtanaerobium respiraculi]